MTFLNLLAAFAAGLLGVTTGAILWRTIRRPAVNATTLAARAGAGAVALVAGYASYRHIMDVAANAGEHGSVAAVLPLSIDGLIIAAAAAMLDDKRNHRRPRWSARIALVFGVVATIAANVASAEPTTTARLVAAVPAVSFLLAVEVALRVGKPIDDPAPATPETVAAWLAEQPEVTPEPELKPAPVTTRRRARPKSLTNAQKVARAAKALPAGSPAEIAAKAGVSETTARRYLPSPSGQGAAETRVNGAELVSASTS